jgi:hypothetical protein
MPREGERFGDYQLFESWAKAAIGINFRSLSKSFLVRVRYGVLFSMILVGTGSTWEELREVFTTFGKCGIVFVQKIWARGGIS